MSDATIGTVPTDRYRDVLAAPGVRTLVLTTLLARIPVTAAPIVLVLHVVLTLHLGFTQSGAVAACAAIGAALGAPLAGRGLDRLGVRPVLAVTALGEAGFWTAAAFVGFHGLLVAAFLGGLLSLPVFTLTRQSLAALLPADRRTTGFAVDSISVEFSYMAGPALGVVAATRIGTRPTLLAIAVIMLGVGLSLAVLNPPVRGEHDEPDRGVRPRLRWWAGGIPAVLVASVGATVTLAGTDAAITAAMRGFHAVGLLGLVTAVWCAASVAGGFVYGARGRPVSPGVLLGLLAGLTVLLAVAPSWWALALLCVPSGVFCAPLISAGAEALTRSTPAAVRGQAMGLQASALTLGNAIGAPLAGTLIDRHGPPSGFVAVGVAGALLAVVSVLGAPGRGPVTRGPRAAAGGGALRTTDAASGTVLGERQAAARPAR